MVRQERGLTVLSLENAQSIMQKAFQLYDVLRFDSTVVICVLINISPPKFNNQFFIFRSIECMNMLLG